MALLVGSADRNLETKLLYLRFDRISPRRMRVSLLHVSQLVPGVVSSSSASMNTIYLGHDCVR